MGFICFGGDKKNPECHLTLKVILPHMIASAYSSLSTKARQRLGSNCESSYQRPLKSQRKHPRY